MATAKFDLAIVGAGINGAGIARDAALRGLQVVVFDKSDMGGGCSAISSRLVHGGLRYLEYGEIPLVYESLRERRILREMAAHLVSPLRISIPVYRGARRGPLLIRLGMMAYDLLSLFKTVPAHEMLDRDAMLAAEPGLRGEGLRAAARYYDAQVTYAERLVLENLLAARDAGAEIRTHCEVTGIDIHGGAVSGVRFRPAPGAQEQRVGATVVVNAAGPWVDSVLAMAPQPSARLIGGTKGSHIVVGQFPGAPQDAFYVEAAADGRPFFIIPWNAQYLVGTTDIRYDGDLDRIRASDAEIDYLLDETNRVFPGAKLERADIHFAYAGVRPLPHRRKGPESAITRRHIIKANRDVARGLVSIIGGKLTTYRSLAEQAVDRLARLQGWRLPACRTRNTPLPGAQGLPAARDALALIDGLSTAGVERLLSVYGGRAARIADLCSGETHLARLLDAAGTVLAAEVVFAMREEFAAELEDIVFRRLMLGLDADQGRPLYAEIAAIAAREAGWQADETARRLDALGAYSESFKVGEGA